MIYFYIHNIIMIYMYLTSASQCMWCKASLSRMNEHALPQHVDFKSIIYIYIYIYIYIATAYRSLESSRICLLPHQSISNLLLLPSTVKLLPLRIHAYLPLPCPCPCLLVLYYSIVLLLYYPVPAYINVPIPIGIDTIKNENCTILQRPDVQSILKGQITKLVQPECRLVRLV